MGEGRGVRIAAGARRGLRVEAGPGATQSLGDEPEALAVRLLGEPATEQSVRLGQLLGIAGQARRQSPRGRAGRRAIPGRRRGRRHGLHEAIRDGLVAAQDVVRVDAQRPFRDVGGHARVAVAVAADPAAPAQERPDPRRPCAGPGGSAAPSSAAARGRIHGPVDDPREPRREREQRRVEERHRRPDLVEHGRRDRSQVRGPPQEGDLLAQAAADLGVLGGREARVVHAREQVATATQRDQDRPAARLGRVGGEDRRDRQGRELGVEVLVRPPERPQPPDRLGHRVVQDAVVGGSLAPSQGSDATARLGQVDQLEVERERADDGFRGAEIQSGEVLVEAATLGRIAFGAQPDRSLADPFHEIEQVRTGLLGDDLAEERAQQTDLGRERVAGAGRPDATGFRPDRDRHAARRRGPVAKVAAGTGSGPSHHATATFRGPTLPYACIVMVVTPPSPASRPRPDPGRDDRRRPPAATVRRASRRACPDQLAQLRFLHEVARLATTARTWDELLETVVDGTRDALHADVSSLYLVDRDGAYLTLAATNGLDHYQIGRARVPFGEGVTGRVAASREPLVIPDVRADARFLWVRGIDQRRFVASMLSVPLIWHDQTVGVLNVQTEQPRDFSGSDADQLRAVADLLAGIVEKGRQQSEAEARVESLKAIDEARSELIALVTHELRTPLAVVRAYTDLLAEEPPLAGRTSRDIARRETRAAWHRATLEQVERLDRLVDSILASVRVVPESPASVVPVDLETDRLVRPRLAATVARPAHRAPAARASACRPSRTRPGSARSSSISSRTPSSTPRRTPRSPSTGAWPRASPGSASATRVPGIPEEWRERIFEPYARRDTHTARGSGIGLYAAKRLGESMGARLWCEPALPHGARFVVALPAAVAI